MSRDHRRPAAAAASPGQVARDLAADLMRELTIYQTAAEELRELAPDVAFAHEDILREVRGLVADVEVYLGRSATDLLDLDDAAVAELVRAVEHARRAAPVKDFEARRSRLRPGGWYHETVVVAEAVRALDESVAAARDEQMQATLGRAVRAAVAAAGDDPARVGRLIREALDEMTSATPPGTWPNTAQLEPAAGDGAAPTGAEVPAVETIERGA